MEEYGVLCKEGERIDDLLSPSFKIIQNERHFRFTMDAVVLAHFTRLKEKDRVIDLGTGTGVIPLLIAGRHTSATVVGLEIQGELVDMARRSVKLNNLGDRVAIEEMDLKCAPGHLGYESADVVVSNPPYRPLGKGDQNPRNAVAIARHEVCCCLEDIMRVASQLLKYHGRFYMVHLAERLADIMSYSRRFQLEPKRLRMVHSTSGEEAKLVLIEMVKGARSSLKIMKPLIIYERPGCYTQEVYQYYFPEGKDEEHE